MSLNESAEPEEAIEQAIEAIKAEIEQIDRRDKLSFYEPYEWQKEFHAAGKDYPERCLLAANRVGKTYSAAAEVAFHLTGDYPGWWEGKRFEHPPLVWTGSVTNEASRDIVQLELLGEPVGTGAIPADKIAGKIRYRQAGTPNVADSASVKHVSGGVSKVSFKTYEQGWRKWQGGKPDAVWLDEEPDESADQKGIFVEALTRILSTRGTLFATLTPLLGSTELVDHFMNPPAGAVDGIYMQTATWEQAPHLDDAAKKHILASYPSYQKDTRSKGIPMMGEGKVFPIPEEDIKYEAHELGKIPKHWARIFGVDFGSSGSGGHPQALVCCALDRDTKTFYVYDCYRKKGESTVYHADAMKARGDWIPVAWPHDGMNAGKFDGVPLYRDYLTHGAKMLSMSARYDNEKGGSQPVEPIVMTASEMMTTGRFKVASHLHQWWEEFRTYHRKDAKIVAVKDDLLKATFYALMMKRFATTNIVPKSRPRYRESILK